MASDNSGTLALLIDGDNASPKIVVGLMAEIANYRGERQAHLWRLDRPQPEGLEGMPARTFNSAGPASRLHDRQERDRWGDDHRRHGSLGFAAIGALKAVSAFEVDFALPPRYVLFTIAGSVVVAVLASLYPASRAAREGAAESVHYE